MMQIQETQFLTLVMEGADPMSDSVECTMRDLHRDLVALTGC